MRIMHHAEEQNRSSRRAKLDAPHSNLFAKHQPRLAKQRALEDCARALSLASWKCWVSITCTRCNILLCTISSPLLRVTLGTDSEAAAGTHTDFERILIIRRFAAAPRVCLCWWDASGRTLKLQFETLIELNADMELCKKTSLCALIEPCSKCCRSSSFKCEFRLD